MQRRGQVEDSRLFIKLPVSHVDRLAFDVRSFEELVEIGYRHTLDALRASDQLDRLVGRS
jgi:hypothetical protein